MNAILARRLWNHRLTGRHHRGSRDVVMAQCAVQSQDFEPALWSVAMRTSRPSRALALSRLSTGDVVRTHVLRPTWHFVSVSDLEWLVGLTGPRIISTTASRQRRLGLTDKRLERAVDLLEQNLKRRSLLRRELAAILRDAGFTLEDNRLAHILMFAEAQGVVCGGPPRDGQHTYALVRDVVRGRDRTKPADPATELLTRYLSSHAPATIDDFRWWSSLPAREARRAVETLGGEVTREQAQGFDLLGLREQAREADVASPCVLLLQAYDEFIVGYGHSRTLMAASRSAMWHRSLTGVVVVDGMHAGNWRLRRGDDPHVDLQLVRSLSRSEHTALDVAIQDYLAYVG